MINENNDLVISYVVHGQEKNAALLAFEESKNTEKRLEVEVKPYRSKRSLEQNKLLWALLGKMAYAMSGRKNKVSSEECYCIMLEEANVYSINNDKFIEAYNILKENEIKLTSFKEDYERISNR